MLRRLVLLAAALLLCLTSASASLPVHVNEEPPEDWEEDVAAFEDEVVFFWAPADRQSRRMQRTERIFFMMG